MIIFFRLVLFFILFISVSFPYSNNSCALEEPSQYQFRTEYNVGDTLTIEDQNVLYPVCNGSEDYQTGDSFSFADLNGDLNGGDYKMTIISMNATW